MIIESVLSAGLGFVAAGTLEDDVMAVGTFRVSATLERSTQRDGLLVVTSSASDRAFGYIDWKPLPGHGRTVEQFVAVPNADGGAIEIWGFLTESLGAYVPPRMYAVRRGENPRTVEGLGHASYAELRNVLPWSVNWKSERIPELAPAFAPRFADTLDRNVALSTLSRWCRIEGTELMSHAAHPVLTVLLESEDAFAREIATRKLELARIESSFREKLDLTDLVHQMQGEMQGLMLQGMIGMFLGQELGVQDVGEALGSRGGAIDKANDRRMEAAKLAIDGLAGEQRLREFVRAEYYRGRGPAEQLVSSDFSVEVYVEDDDVVLAISNRTGRTLKNVVLCPEFAMDAAKVMKDIVTQNTAELPFQFLLPLMGVDSNVAAKTQVNQSIGMGLYAAPQGSLTFVSEWGADATVEVQACPRVGGFVRYADAGSLWIGSDGAELHVDLAVDSMRESIEEWRARGNHRRPQKMGTKFYRPSAGEYEDERQASSEPMTLAREVGSRMAAGSGSDKGAPASAKCSNVAFVLEVLDAMQRTDGELSEKTRSSNLETWRSYLTLAGISQREREEFSTLLGQKAAKVRGLETALLGTGCGIAIDAKEVRPGDFVQYWWKSAKDSRWKIENMHVAIVARIDIEPTGRKFVLYGAHRSLLASESTLNPADRKGGIGESIPVDLDNPKTTMAFFARSTKLTAVGK